MDICDTKSSTLSPYLFKAMKTLPASSFDSNYLKVHALLESNQNTTLLSLSLSLENLFSEESFSLAPG